MTNIKFEPLKHIPIKMVVDGTAVEGEIVSLYPNDMTVDDDTAQVECVVSAILENREAGTPLKEQAVLFRTAHHSALLEIELTSGG